MDATWDLQRERHRANCYKLLAACFYEPDYAVFTEANLFGNLEQNLKPFGENLAELAGMMAKEFTAGKQEAMAIAHAKLFIGPFELTAPPYGSIYLEPGSLMMGETTVAVRQMYEQHGLSLRDDLKDAPDHIAFELEFMYYLCERLFGYLQDGEKQAAADSLAVQTEFQTKYLAGWVDPFCQCITDNSEQEFYVLLAKCLSGFCQSAEIPIAVPMQKG